MTMLQPRRLGPLVAILACGAVLSSSAAQDGGSGATPACPALETAPSVAFCENISSLDQRMPAGVSESPDALPIEDAQRMFDCLSWKTFIALNWPSDKNCRGIPDKSAKLADSKSLRVWETFKEVFEVFQDNDASWDPSSQDWNSPVPQIQCSAAVTGDRKVIHLKTKGVYSSNSVTEFEQAFATSFGQLTDQAGNLVRYEVRFNRDEFEHLKASGFAATGKYSYGGPILAEGETFSLPDNRNGFEGVGATEIKASWKEITKADDASRYYTQEVVIYDTQADPVCREATLGLLGLHIARKIYHAPQMTWATFEHVDNTPPMGSDGDGRQYTLFSKECAANQPSACWAVQPPISNKDMTCCPNLELNTALLTGIPTQATKLNPFGPTELNETFRKLLKDAGSPFQYYQLSNTQFTLGGRDPTNPDRVRTQYCNPNGAWAIPAATDDCFTQVPENLRNTSMETFMASYGVGTTETSADSCLNCHVAGGVDGSYIWLDAKLQPVPIVK